MATTKIPKSYFPTMNITYGSGSSQVTGNSDATITVDCTSLFGSHNRVIGVLVIGYTPSASWDTELFIKGYDLSNINASQRTFNISVRAQGSVTQTYGLNIMYFYN